jgi:hypothetical protein
MAQGTDSVYIQRMALSDRKAAGTVTKAGLFSGLLVSLAFSSVFAQSGPPRMPQFEADAPKVGEALPDVVIHDDLGNPVNLRELSSENYKVLVLGCLT